MTMAHVSGDVARTEPIPGIQDGHHVTGRNAPTWPEISPLDRGLDASQCDTDEQGFRDGALWIGGRCEAGASEVGGSGR